VIYSYVGLECELTDYSLLIGVRRRKFGVVDNKEFEQQLQNTSPSAHVKPSLAPVQPNASVDSQYNSKFKRNPFQQDSDGGMHAGLVEGPGTYYFGIIDILEQWTWRKRMERWVKCYFRCLDPEGISAMAPAPYADRFWKRAVRDVFEYVEQGLDEDLDATPNFNPVRFLSSSGDSQRKSAIGPRSSSIGAVEPSKNRLAAGSASPIPPASSAIHENDRTVSGEANFRDIQIQQRETDRRFSLIPMDKPSNFSMINRSSTANNLVARKSIAAAGAFERVAESGDGSANVISSGSAGDGARPGGEGATVYSPFNTQSPGPKPRLSGHAPGGYLDMDDRLSLQSLDNPRSDGLDHRHTNETEQTAATPESHFLSQSSDSNPR
jgi:hypothetical protein